MASKDDNSRPMVGKKRLLRFLSVAAFFLVLAAVVSIVHFYPSMTLWYKSGAEKTALLIGQIAGLIALVLLLLQIVLSSRGPFLEDLFGAVTLIKWHRINGLIVLGFVALHIFLILLPEGLDNLPIGLKFWPEMVGSLLFWVVAAMVISSHFRERLRLDYKKWRRLHQPLGYLVLILLAVHVLFVSDSFEHPVPKYSVLALFFAVVLRVISVKWLPRKTDH
jgi:predicted ferric reductase